VQLVRAARPKTGRNLLPNLSSQANESLLAAPRKKETSAVAIIVTDREPLPSVLIVKVRIESAPEGSRKLAGSATEGWPKHRKEVAESALTTEGRASLDRFGESYKWFD
jgi:hypothetical protein